MNQFGDRCSQSPFESGLCQWLVKIFSEHELDIQAIRQAYEAADGKLTLITEQPIPLRGPRWDHQAIISIVTPGSRVLDCGCGTGDLLARLVKEKKVIGQGIELNSEAVQQAIQRGVPVFQTDLDEGLEGFGHNAFDFAILETTLQTVHKPMCVLQEMLRVARVAIVSFPNFACWRNRLQLFLEGKMPRTSEIPYEWYDTPNIHHLTIRDFIASTQKIGLQIVKSYTRTENQIQCYEPSHDLMADEALFVLTRAEEYIDGAGV